MITAKEARKTAADKLMEDMDKSLLDRLNANIDIAAREGCLESAITVRDKKTAEDIVAILMAGEFFAEYSKAIMVDTYLVQFNWRNS